MRNGLLLQARAGTTLANLLPHACDMRRIRPILPHSLPHTPPAEQATPLSRAGFRPAAALAA